MEDNLKIGERIAELRRRRNISIKELAEKTGVTSSLLSQIERGLANPSLNSLRALALALEVPITVFFQESFNGKDLVVRKNKRKKLQLPDSDEVIYELLSPNASKQIEFALMNIKPGVQSIEKPMAHTGEEAAIVLGGSIKLTLGEEELILNDGDSVCIPPNIPHKWQNIDKKDVMVIFAVSPPSF
jgi:transcriptional regulator with XRE-family HTH domain